MLKHRVIPCLLLRNGGLVKTTRFANPKYVGDPINAIHIFNDKEVDEIILLDIAASKQGTEPDFDLITQISGECFMPLCYGGGISKLDQARRLFSLGVEKISLQTAVFDDFGLIEEAAKVFGSQSVVVSIDVRRDWLSRPRLYKSSVGKTSRRSWKEQLTAAVESGAGEIAINCVDKDGLMKGMDWEIISEACSLVGVPVIAMGGVGSLEDIKRAVQCGASAVAAGAYFVFHGPHRAVLITYPNYNELESLLNFEK